MHLCVMQEERIELLDKLEQFPLKIRVKEEQESILRWAGCCSCSALTTFVPMSVDVRCCMSSLAAFCIDVCACQQMMEPLSGIAIMLGLSAVACKLVLLPCSAATISVMDTTAWTQDLLLQAPYLSPPPPSSHYAPI